MGKIYVNTGGYICSDDIKKTMDENPVMTNGSIYELESERYDGVCTVTASSKRLFMTIPAITSLLCEEVTITSLQAEVREQGKYLYGTGSSPLPDMVADSNLTLTYDLTPFGLNIRVDNVNAFPNAVNNGACSTILLVSGSIKLRG